MREAMRGKTLARILTNAALEDALRSLSGSVLDIAGGKKPSYLPLLAQTAVCTRSDLQASDGVVAIDFNASLPFPDAAFDAALLINALYIAEDPATLAAEVSRILKPGGRWIIVSPFIANEMQEPHDYLRFSAEGLERLCVRAGFQQIAITRIGERASAATHIMQPFFLFNIIRAPFFVLALLLDRAIPKSVRAQHPTPLSYLVECTKPST